MARYIPQKGDTVFLDFAPVKGHEQSGRRPAIVISPKAYNVKSGLALVCPITSKIKRYPFEVVVLIKDQSSVVLADQIRCVDWRGRHARKIGEVSEAVLREVIHKVSLLIQG